MNYEEFKEKYIIPANKLNPDSKEFKEIQKEAINLKNAYFIYWFTEYVKEADIQKCQDAIINIGEASCIYQFARYIKGADINKLKEAIFKTKDEKYISLFKNEILKNKQLKFNQ